MNRSRTILLAGVLGAVLVLAGAFAAASAGTEVADRQAAMKQVGQTMKAASAFTSASTPYDPAKVKLLMDTIAADAQKLKGLYPPDTASDPKTAADPKIWQDKADFEKRLGQMGSAALAVENAKDSDSFKTAFGAVGATCKSCHDVYRMKKKS
jgi:cytochrome c556